MSPESNTKFYITTFITVLLAASGYMWSLHLSKEMAQYEARLVRVNEQLREFYGPLHSLIESEDQSFGEFIKATRPGKGYFWNNDDPPNEEQKKMWRLWIVEVTIPNYIAMEQIIQKRSDLIVEATMPQELIALEAHIAGYKPVVAAWKEHDYSRNYSFFSFPQQARVNVKDRFASLKQEQEMLLGKVRKQ